MTKPHIMFRDKSGKLHATPALSLAADLAELCGSEVFARRAMEIREKLREAFDRADILESMFPSAQTSFTPQQIAAIQGDGNAHLSREN